MRPTESVVYSGKPRMRPLNPRRVSKFSDVGMHFRFVLWAMQVRDIDTITISRVEQAMGVSRKTAERLRREWREVAVSRTCRAAMEAMQ